MNNQPEAGLEETGHGRLDGLLKETVREDDFQEETKVDGLAQRMATNTVFTYAEGRNLTDEELHHVLDMLGLPHENNPPTPEEQSLIVHNLPDGGSLNLLAPTDPVAMSERRLPGSSNRVW